MAKPGFFQIQKEIVSCTKCPRLIKYCRKIGQEKRASFKTDHYWAKPVPSFSPSNADNVQVLFVGLAPAAHGANRTGRMFTGDRSGEWLYEALHQYGFASQSNSVDKNDGLFLTNCIISAVVHCAPPDNKPSRTEIQNCRRYLLDELTSLNRLRCIVALGKIAYDETLKALSKLEIVDSKFKKPIFQHGLKVEINPQLTLLTSYHPSQQNTFTGKLTGPMFYQVFENIRSVLHS